MIRKSLLAAAVAIAISASPAFAGAIHDAAMFTGNTLAANDDGSTGAVNIGFTVDFFGTNYSSLFVNNNGNVTFDSPLSTFTPFSLLSTSHPMLAPFFGDVDTRAGALVQYGSGSIGGHAVFGVNWINVGYYSAHTDKLNSFQLIITDRSDTGAGNFDFEFNIDQIQWETGDASSGSGGLGGSSARSGWSDGTSHSFEIAGSAVNGAFLDSNLASGLIYNSINSNIDGQYIFSVRNGQVLPPPGGSVPEPGTLALAGLGLAGLAGLRRKANKA